ncbi:hypothetical protein OG520_23155 [Streptomyces sp. NBC_00984]|uniref:hypothetical protein n=1 Tax=Streptomyces sp. NBC_00984 TaxID=2903700 RepID=UPI00386C28B5|nr:hypothetical protein OG520_23155 [Streptomyces sp. NBC_00984]
MDRTRLKSLGSLVSALALAALLPVLVALWVGDGVQKLLTGDSATVHSVTQCVEGGGQLPAAHCYGTWAFADGRTASGEITGAEVAAGDTIFAGDGWAYDSTSPLHWRIWTPVTIFGAGAAALTASWLSYRRSRDAPAPGRSHEDEH